MVVCHGLGAPYFTVYVLSCGTEHEHKATGVGEGWGDGGDMKNPHMTHLTPGISVE